MPITVQQKTGYFNELAPAPAIQSCDPGQLIPCFDSCQLTIMWMSIIKLQFQILARKCDISNWFSCGADGSGGRTDRPTDVRSGDYQNFLDALDNQILLPW